MCERYTLYWYPLICMASVIQFLIIVLYIIVLALVHAAQYVVWFNGLLSVIVFDQILVHYNCLLLLPHKLLLLLRDV